MRPQIRQLAGLLVACFLIGSVHAKLNIFACEPEWAALTQELAGGHATVFAATHAGQDPHYVQARPSLIARLRSADLAVCTGAELETGWMPMLQRRARNPKVLAGKPGYFEATQQVTLLEKPAELDRAEGDVHGDGNPHIQVDPRRVLEVAMALSSRLQQLDPGNKPNYEQLLQDFTARWKASIERWQSAAAGLRGKRAVVHHREWIYLLDWLGMQRVGSLEPKPGIPPNMAHLADLKTQQADVIILSPANDKKPSAWLQEQTGTPVVMLPHTVGAVPNSDNLFDLFDEIIRRLSESART
ncbi:MAG: zinc ABC transporter substrate-binding protein [Gammaproteobacteria bacterium]|nr:zinc ABC transporter substrate-binding protein [Gammaproteobacteria bacterium]